MQQGGNANAFSEAVNSSNNSGNQILVTSPMSQIPQSHQGPPQVAKSYQENKSFNSFINLIKKKSFQGVRIFHNAPMGQDNSPHVIVPTHLVIHSQQVGPPQSHGRPPRSRDEQIADFRKFKNNFNLAQPKNQRGNVRIC